MKQKVIFVCQLEEWESLDSIEVSTPTPDEEVKLSIEKDDFIIVSDKVLEDS